VFLSGRNLPTVHVMPYSDVSTYHILWSDVVLIEAGALGQSLDPIAEAAWSDEGEARNAKAAAKKPAAKTSAKRAAAPAAKKAAKKTRKRRPPRRRAPRRSRPPRNRRRRRRPLESRRRKSRPRRSVGGSNQCRHYIARSCDR
jgi:hypothetical protein